MAQEKVEGTILELPQEPIYSISHYASVGEQESSLSNLAAAHTIFSHNPFQKDRILGRLALYVAEGKIERVTSLLNICPDLRIEVLFTLAGLGAQDEMETLLRHHPEALLVSRPLRDISGAEFEPISLFQHCLWSKDVRYMANMMLDCLPQNEIGEAIRQKLVHQYEKHMAKGASYQLNGVRHENELHFSLQPLITALRTYVDNYNNWTVAQRDLHWCTIVGLAQTLLPAHIRHHYCDKDESFIDNPNFKKPKLKRSLEIYNWLLEKNQLWCEALSGLGVNSGIRSGRGPHGTVIGPAQGTALSTMIMRNLTGLTDLDTVRTEIDMPALIQRLQTPIQNLDEKQSIQAMGL